MTFWSLQVTVRKKIIVVKIAMCTAKPSCSSFSLLQRWESEAKEGIVQWKLNRSLSDVNVVMHILYAHAHANTHHCCSYEGETKGSSCVLLICWEHYVESGSGTVHRIHSRDEQCCLLASLALSSSNRISTYTVGVCRCGRLSIISWCVCLFTCLAPLLPSLNIKLPICNDMLKSRRSVHH